MRTRSYILDWRDPAEKERIVLLDKKVCRPVEPVLPTYSKSASNLEKFKTITTKSLRLENYVYANLRSVLRINQFKEPNWHSKCSTKMLTQSIWLKHEMLWLENVDTSPPQMAFWLVTTRTNRGVNNKIDDGGIPFRFFDFRYLVKSMQNSLPRLMNRTQPLMLLVTTVLLAINQNIAREKGIICMRSKTAEDGIIYKS